MHLRESLSSGSTPFAKLPAKLGGEPEKPATQEEPQVRATQHYQPQRRLTEDEVDTLVIEYKSGKSALEVAKQFGIHRQTVARLLAKRSVPLHPRTTIDARLLAELNWQYERGKSTVELGRQYGLAASSVGKALKKSGVKLRSPKFNRWESSD